MTPIHQLRNWMRSWQHRFVKRLTNTRRWSGHALEQFEDRTLLATVTLSGGVRFKQVAVPQFDPRIYDGWTTRADISYTTQLASTSSAGSHSHSRAISLTSGTVSSDGDHNHSAAHDAVTLANTGILIPGFSITVSASGRHSHSYSSLSGTTSTVGNHSHTVPSTSRDFTVSSQSTLQLLRGTSTLIADFGTVTTSTNGSHDHNGQVTANGDHDHTYSPTFSTSVTYTYFANRSPVAHAGGANGIYLAPQGQSFQLSANGSSDADTFYGDQLTFEWDLDGDGLYDDATGATPTISAGTLDSLIALRGVSFEIALKVIDFVGAQTIATARINVPTAPGELAVTSQKIDENLPANSLLANVSAIDPNFGDTLTFSLPMGVTDNDLFEISGTTLSVLQSFNFEEQSEYTITLRAADQTGLHTDTEFTISVNDINEAPVDLDLNSTTVSENQPVGTVIGNLSTVDVDANDQFTYELASGDGDQHNAFFRVSGTQLQTSKSFDFEGRDSFQIRLRTLDSGSLVYEESVTIEITDLNDVPEQVSLNTDTVAENAGAGTVVGSFLTVDDDFGDEFTYELVFGEGDEDNGSFEIVGSELRTRAVFDFETDNNYSVRVRAIDKVGAFIEQRLPVWIEDVNEAPAIEISTSSVILGEDVDTASGIRVASLTLIDDALGANILSLTGPDAGDFELRNGTDIFLKTGTVLDGSVKSKYVVGVAVDDANVGGTPDDEEFLTLAINGAPTIALENAIVEISENADTSIPLKVADLTILDEGFGSNALSLSGTDASLFEIIGAELLIRSGTGLNFEQSPTLAVTVEVDDDSVGGTPDSSETLTISLLDVNEAPVVTGFSATVSAGASLGTIVGTVLAEEPDLGQSATFSLLPGIGSDAFEIHPDTGQIRVADPNVLNSLSGSVLTLSISATDDGTSQATGIGSVTVEVAPVPVVLVLGLASNSLLETAGSTLGIVTRTGDLAEPLEIQLHGSDHTEARVPGTVTIPADMAFTTFVIDVVDDQFVDGTQTVTITGQA
ncbi:MAG: cadherin domain-containing protein, partial [Planctomycetaceae bacterium]|nr:cadherin domain-containing protein [Planctomycetaceae bacterium]